MRVKKGKSANQRESELDKTKMLINSIIQQILDFLLWSRHCSGPWGHGRGQVSLLLPGFHSGREIKVHEATTS